MQEAVVEGANRVTGRGGSRSASARTFTREVTASGIRAAGTDAACSGASEEGGAVPRAMG